VIAKRKAVMSNGKEGLAMGKEVISYGKGMEEMVKRNDVMTTAKGSFGDGK
jgi:hypothetical protein